DAQPLSLHDALPIAGRSRCWSSTPVRRTPRTDIRSRRVRPRSPGPPRTSAQEHELEPYRSPTGVGCTPPGSLFLLYPGAARCRYRSNQPQRSVRQGPKIGRASCRERVWSPLVGEDVDDEEEQDTCREYTN